MPLPEIAGIVTGDARPLDTSPGPGRWSAPGIALAGISGPVMLDSDCVVVADARIDNRGALCRDLGLPADAPEAAVIARAYRRWGEDCAARIEGSFAFALWDAGRRRLLCARDLMGVRPLCYRVEGTTLRFAQSPAALAEDQAGTRSVSDQAVADFLFGRVLDAEGTWFAGVRRVPAGHCLVHERGTARLIPYRRITAIPHKRGTDPAIALRDLLDAAVARRAGDGENVGVLLSGGLDSSAIACLLRDRRKRAGAAPLPVFSMMFREPARSNERHHLDAVLATGGFAPHVLDLDGYAPLAGFESLLEATGGPTLSPNLACMRAVVAAAADRGIAVLLDGHGGDEVVSHGYGLLDELAARGSWAALWREARGAADNYGRSRLVLTRRVAARQPRLDARIIARALAPFDREAAPAAERPPAHLLSRDLLARSTLPERLRTLARPEAAGGEQAQHHAVLADPLQPYAFEVHAAFYRSMGVAARYPFWDREVVEFCLGLPAHEKLSQGWSRLVLRKAMAGIVPDSVLQRRDKIDFSVHLARGLVRHHHAQISELLASSASPLAPYVDLERAQRTYAAIAADPDATTGRAVQMVWRAVALGIWLETGCGARATVAPQPHEAAA
jgi:asparagine synthase (glutamine-hydrolysing)